MININPGGVDFSSVRAAGVSDNAISRLANMPSTSGPTVEESSDTQFEAMLASIGVEGPGGDPVEKRALMMKIQRYKEVFAHVLRDINLSGLEFKTQQDLEGLLDEVRSLFRPRIAEICSNRPFSQVSVR